MKTFLKQPLFHFLLIGVFLFLAYHFAGFQEGRDPASQTVRVDKAALLKFMQYRSKAFEQRHFEKKLAAMTPEELQLLIDDFVREEVLYREALSLGLDQEDYIIRRRLMSKLEFIAQGFSEENLEISDQDLQKFFEENKSRYYVEPYATFTHVFFDNEKHGAEAAKELASKEIIRLNQDQVPFDKAGTYGDRFLYHLNYVERVPDYVASHFGEEMAKEVFIQTPDDRLWKGPFASPYGYHLVMLTGKIEGRSSNLDEIRGRVMSDARVEFLQKKKEKLIKDIIEKYDIRIVYPSQGRETLAVK